MRFAQFTTARFAPKCISAGDALRFGGAEVRVNHSLAVVARKRPQRQAGTAEAAVAGGAMNAIRAIYDISAGDASHPGRDFFGAGNHRPAMAAHPGL